LLSTVARINDFRNTRVAHQEKEVTDPTEAQQHLVVWIKGLKALTLAGPQQ
jgi:type III restriction enzyme